MKSLPFDTIGLTDYEEKTLLETCNKLGLKFKISFDGHLNLYFPDYDLFKNYTHIFQREILEVSTQKFECYLLLLQLQYPRIEQKYAKNPALEYQYYGSVKVNRDFGHVLIRRNTFLDKIYEIFKPIQLTFKDDNDFNRKFYVLTKDKAKAKSAMDTKFRRAVLNLNVDNIFIEIVNHQLLVGSKTIMDSNNALQFVKFMKSVAEID